MMIEVSRRYDTEPLPPPVGGLSSARALARFNAARLDVLAGTATVPIDGELLRDLLVERTERAFDPVLARPAGFGRGFMVDLAAHDFGRHCSPRSFGHGGFAAGAWAFADPAHDLVVAYVQTARFEAARAVHAVREPLVDLLYEQLALVSAAAG
jgi:CubicO group peptidase (beta-lactamase class C family)